MDEPATVATPGKPGTAAAPAATAAAPAATAAAPAATAAAPAATAAAPAATAAAATTDPRTEAPGTPPSPPEVTVRYWAAARAVAGVAEDRLCGVTLADVLAACRKAHASEPRFERVLSACSLLIGESPLGARDPADVPLREGDVIDVLPPFAGG